MEFSTSGPRHNTFPSPTKLGDFPQYLGWPLGFSQGFPRPGALWELGQLVDQDDPAMGCGQAQTGSGPQGVGSVWRFGLYFKIKYRPPLKGLTQ